MNVVNRARDLWPWQVDRVLITFEAIFFLAAFFLFGGMARLGAGADSLGELLSNFFVLRFMKEDLKYWHPECHPGDEHDHTREKATENVALTFFGLAIMTLLFHVIAGEQPPTEGTEWIDWIAGVFTVSTGVIGVVKLIKSKLQKGSPALADALQSLLCVLASLITIVASYFHPRFPLSHTIGEGVIVALMFIAGTVILKTKKLCC